MVRIRFRPGRATRIAVNLLVAVGRMSIYEQWGLEPIINASGAVTRLGRRPDARRGLEAFVAAAGESRPAGPAPGGGVAASSRRSTGAEAGLVTGGAAAALTLGAAAILAGYDLGRMERLPHCDGFPHEFVVAREQRNGYDHAVRAAGARLVEVGFHEIVAGAGVRRAEAWEYEAAFGPMTAGVLYVLDARLAAAAGRRRDAGPRPRPARCWSTPPANCRPARTCRDILATGADLVAFSGGKAIRGPQATGILCGRRDLVGAAALQMLDMDDHYRAVGPARDLIDRHATGRHPPPRHRPGPQGFQGADRRPADGPAAVRQRRLRRRAARPTPPAGTGRRRPGRPAGPLPVDVPADGQSLPLLEIALDEGAVGRTALEVCRGLRRGRPPVQVGHGLLHEGKLVINPLHLDDARAAVLARRLRDELSPDHLRSRPHHVAQRPEDTSIRLGAGEPIADRVRRRPDLVADQFDAWWREECRRRCRDDRGIRLGGPAAACASAATAGASRTSTPHGRPGPLLRLRLRDRPGPPLPARLPPPPGPRPLAEVLGAGRLESDVLVRTLDLGRDRRGRVGDLPDGGSRPALRLRRGRQRPDRGDPRAAADRVRPARLPARALVAGGLPGDRGGVLLVSDRPVPGDRHPRAGQAGPRRRAALPGLPPGRGGRREHPAARLLPRVASARPGRVGQTVSDPDQGHGSNNWVLAGARTTTGKPLVASDPHVPFGAVSMWHEVHLRGGSFHVMGVSYAGMPAVMIGRTERVAWGVTNNICSLRDLYQEKADPDHPGCFLYDGRWEPVRERREVIHVRGGAGRPDGPLDRKRPARG